MSFCKDCGAIYSFEHTCPEEIGRLEALQADNERLTNLHRKAVAETAILLEEKTDRDEEIERLREALRENVGEAYNLITQGESPTQRRQPSAQRIYDCSKEALTQRKVEEDGRA